VHAAESSLALDLSHAYPTASRYHRVAKLNAGVITIADEWDGSAEQHFIIAGTPITHEPGRLHIKTLTGGDVELKWDAGAGRVESRAVDDDLLERSWGPTVHRLIITPDHNALELTISPS
jgi:hypothetical protein